MAAPADPFGRMQVRRVSLGPDGRSWRVTFELRGVAECPVLQVEFVEIGGILYARARPAPSGGSTGWSGPWGSR